MISQALKIVGIVVLLCVALLLYVDLVGTHQIHPITQAMIDRADSAEARQVMIADRESRNGEERIQKGIFAGVLAADLLAIIWLGSKLFRRAKPGESQTNPSP